MLENVKSITASIGVRLEDPELMPTRANPTDAGLDLRCKEDTVLPSGERVLVKTGVSVRIPAYHVGLLFPRSSLSKYGITMTNSVGVIDSDYRGEVMASLMYHGEDYIKIKKGERIVQLVIVPVLLPKPYQVNCTDEEWLNTTRGAGGFGSTGKT